MFQNNKSLINKINIRKNHGLSSRDTCDYFSCNCRLDEIHASILNVQIKQIDKINRIKRRIAKIYNDNLSNYVEVPFEKKNEYHVYQTYIIFSKNRDKLQSYLKEKRYSNFSSLSSSYSPSACFQKFRLYKGSFPIAEKLSSEVLSLPSFVGMRESQIDYVIQNIKKFYR